MTAEEAKVEEVVEVKQMAEAILEDGTSIYTDSDAWAVEVRVFGKDADGNEVALADGEYKLADGTTITVTSGIVAEIATAQEEATESSEPNPMDALMARLAAVEEQLKNLSSTNATLETQLGETKKALSVSLEAIDQMNEKAVAISLEEQKPKKQEIDFAKLDQYQRYQLAKYGEIRY